ncbi:MAG TPA: hypothetical protein VLA99_11065 [Nitrospiraceae bacterium]|nr:hypothetical protein [Nitrospiraceae bacterium]
MMGRADRVSAVFHEVQPALGWEMGRQTQQRAQERSQSIPAVHQERGARARLDAPAVTAGIKQPVGLGCAGFRAEYHPSLS